MFVNWAYYVGGLFRQWYTNTYALRNQFQSAMNQFRSAMNQFRSAINCSVPLSHKAQLNQSDGSPNARPCRRGHRHHVHPRRSSKELRSRETRLMKGAEGGQTLRGRWKYCSAAAKARKEVEEGIPISTSLVTKTV